VGFDFSYCLFPFLFSPLLIWVFTEVLQEIRHDITRKVWISYTRQRSKRDSCGGPAWTFSTEGNEGSERRPGSGQTGIIFVSFVIFCEKKRFDAPHSTLLALIAPYLSVPAAP
jgi:hypothetical protein